MLLAKLKFKTRSIKSSLSRVIRTAWYQAVRAPFGNLAWRAWSKWPFVSNRIISRRNGIRTFQAMTLIEVDPERVSRFVQDTDVQRKIMLWDGDWDLRSRPLSEHYRYRPTNDLWQHRDSRLIKANVDRKRLIAAQTLNLSKISVRIAHVHQLQVKQHDLLSDCR